MCAIAGSQADNTSIIHPSRVREPVFVLIIFFVITPLLKNRSIDNKNSSIETFNCLIKIFDNFHRRFGSYDFPQGKIGFHLLVLFSGRLKPV